MTAAITSAQVLRDAKALISDPAKWTQGVSAGDADGIPCVPFSSRAVCWCSIGAIRRVSFHSRASAGSEIDANHWLAAAVDGGVAAFNDTHTHPEVMAAFDRAIELAETGQ